MHLYERIFEDLKRSIDEGELRPSERLPSIREVAQRYGCNKITAQRAFDLLEEAGVVENLVGAGSFVTFPKPLPEKTGDFSAARLSEDFFPYEEASGLLAGVLAREKGKVFSASPARGEPSLIAALARRFALDEDSIVVTGGGLQGLDLCRRLFAGRGKAGREEAEVLVEEPCFPAALGLFRPTSFLPLGPGGPDPEAFEAFCLKPTAAPSATRVFYAVPDIHNPTGLRYSEETKRAIARMAREREVWIVEDDYLSELEPSGIPRFVDLVPERTIWIKSLSKTTAPGIRIGVISAPPALVSRVEVLKAEVDTGPAAWLQFFAEGLLSSGLIDGEMARTASVISRRRAELAALIAAFPGLSFDPATAGYNLWVASDREPRLESPPWAEGKRFGFSPGLRRHFRLSFMAVGEADWKPALRRLGLAFGSAFGPAEDRHGV